MKVCARCGWRTYWYPPGACGHDDCGLRRAILRNQARALRELVALAERGDPEVLRAIAVRAPGIGGPGEWARRADRIERLVAEMVREGRGERLIEVQIPMAAE